VSRAPGVGGKKKSKLLAMISEGEIRVTQKKRRKKSEPKKIQKRQQQQLRIKNI